MRRRATIVGVGATLLIAAVVGFVVVPEHRPTSRTGLVSQGRVVPLEQCASIDGMTIDGVRGVPCHNATITSGPRRTLYDTLRITTWVLAIIGGVFVVLGLIRYARLEVGQ